MDQPREQYIVHVVGRDIPIYSPTEGQAAQVTRAVSTMQRLTPGVNAAVPIARILDVVMTLVVNDDDRMFIDDGLTDGSIGLEIMTEMIKQLVDDVKGDEAEGGNRATMRAAQKRVATKRTTTATRSRGSR